MEVEKGTAIIRTPVVMTFPSESLTSPSTFPKASETVNVPINKVSPADKVGERKTGEADESEVRTIEAVYSQGATLSAMSSIGAIDYMPTLIIHWGPVVSYTSIDFEPNQKYPRKYSAGQIKGYDEVNDNINGALPSGNWALYDYVAYYKLGNAPGVKLSDYETTARNNAVPLLRTASGPPVAAPHDTSGGFDSGFYTDVAQIRPPTGGGSYDFDCSTCVIYIQCDNPVNDIVSFPNGAFIRLKALIIDCNLDYNGDGKAVFSATVPAKASEQYQHSSLQSPNFFSDPGEMDWTDGDPATLNNVGFHGFMYVSGNMNNAGGTAKVVGSIYVAGKITLSSMEVYYDEDVAQNVEWSDAAIVRSSWDEIVASW